MLLEDVEDVDSPPENIDPPSSILTDSVRDKIITYYSSKRSAKKEFLVYIKNLYESREKDFLW